MHRAITIAAIASAGSIVESPGAATAAGEQVPSAKPSPDGARGVPDWLQRAVIGLERDARLDAVVDRLRAGLGGGVVGCAVAGGEWLGHALHPLLTDLPLGCWLSAGLLDLLGGRRGRPAAQRLVALGLLFVPVTAASGLVDWTSASDVRCAASARCTRSAMSSSAAPTSARGAPGRNTRIAAPRGGSPAASSRGARGTSAGTSPRGMGVGPRTRRRPTALRSPRGSRPPSRPGAPRAPSRPSPPAPRRR